MAHRLVWLYVYGKFPSNAIDHINTIGNDNRFSNLREVTNSQNQMNRKNQKNNTSGYKGVCYEKLTNKWRATIGLNNKLKSIGNFDTKEEAAEAYRKASALLHGEFAYKN